MEPTFTLTAKPDTDVWRKPPKSDVFNAPFRPHTIAPLTHFRSATITFTAAYSEQFDQAGLLLSFTSPAHPSPAGSPSPRKWIKTGIELFGDRPRLSTVSCDDWADWSIADVPGGAGVGADVVAGRRGITVSIERETDAHGTSLWVYYHDGREKTPLREITWVYGENGGEGWELEVSAAVARPDKEATGELKGTFEGFDVKWTEQ